MSVERQLIAEFVSDIWRLVVGRGVQASPDIPEATAGWSFARVQITGAWRGTVTVAADAGLVKALAAAMGEADAGVALGELAGMVAGNLKAVLPPPCYLSKPAVDAGDGCESQSVARLRLRVLQTAFADPAGGFVVTVAETSKPTGRRRNPERPSGINPLSDCEASGRFPQILAEDYVVATPAPRGGSATAGDSVR